MKLQGLRWWMITLVTLGLLTNYLARNTCSVSAAEMMTDLHISNQQYDYTVSTCQICYAQMQPIAGWLIDVLGTKAGFEIFAFAWSLVCMLASLANNWQGWAFFRGLLGITKAAGLPAADPGAQYQGGAFTEAI